MNPPPSSEEEDAFLTTAELGALALLTPGRKLALVHAVQTPLRLATASPAGSLGVRRFSRDTAIYFSGEFRIHGPSTAKIDVLATWEEPDDAGGAPRTFTTHVLELPIHPAGVQFTGRGRPPVATYVENAESMRFVAPESSADAARRLHPARQDFGDTKHRKVTYKLVATTRFPEYFPKDITADPKNITRSLELREIVPSSAPPAAPEIMRILPVFLWSEETTPTHRLIERRRGGGSLRVYLGPRWHSSGEGEKLAFVQVTNSGLV